MPKYLLQVSYTTEGVKGLLKEGGTSRRSTIEALAATQGGSIESFYYAFGTDDVIVIADFPDDTMAAAMSSPSVRPVRQIHTTSLLTPEQIVTATGAEVSYRRPAPERHSGIGTRRARDDARRRASSTRP